MINQLITKYYDGDISLEDVLIQMEEKRKFMETELDFLKGFKDENTEAIEHLIKDYPDGYKGYLFEVRNGRTMFSYKNIDEWKEYNKMLKDCEARYKQAYQSVQKGLLAVSQDGEELQLPEISYGKASVIISKKR